MKLKKKLLDADSENTNFLKTDRVLIWSHRSDRADIMICTDLLLIKLALTFLASDMDIKASART